MNNIFKIILGISGILFILIMVKIIGIINLSWVFVLSPLCILSVIIVVSITLYYIFRYKE